VTSQRDKSYFLSAAPSMALGTLMSRITGLLRIVALAYALGIGGLSDAYNLANNTPNIVYDLVAGGILSATLVPVFVSEMTTGDPEEADSAISAVVTMAGAVLLVGTIVLIAIAPLVIALYSFHSTTPNIALERSEATTLLRWFAPQVALYGICTLAGAILNARRIFAPPMFVPILNNLVCIVILAAVAVFFPHPDLASVRSHSALIVLLGLGTTVGVLAQALALVVAVRRSGARLHLRWDPRHPALRQVVGLSGWTFGFVVANQIAYFIMLALATHIARGAVSAFTYAFAFFQLPYGVIAVSVMSAAQPELAEAWIHSDAARFRRRFTHALGAMMAVVAPAAAGLLALASPLVALVLGHGTADPAATRSTGHALAMLALGLPGFCGFLLTTRAFQALKDTKTVFRLYLLENGINIVLAIALAGPLGVSGLALSVSLAYTFAFAVAVATLAVEVGGLDADRLRLPLRRVALLSCATGVTAWLAAQRVGSSHGTGLALRVLAGVVVGVSVFAAGSVGAAALARRR
jgi:putative peptidoglycan lipid II flippase